MKKKLLYSVFGLVWVLIFISPAMAFKDLTLAGKPLSVMGYINQGVGFGIGGDEYDTREGFQSAIFQALVEAKWEPSTDVQLFVSGMLNVDWAYDVLDSDDDWEDRIFGESDSELHLLSDYEDILKECHLSWTPGNWFIRLGKQIVSWGETDMVRLTDQINPVDQRRGFTDVEFESSIIPIWLAKVEYWFELDSTWLQDCGVEFTFNPNVDFIPDKGPAPGNNVAGIWAPMVTIPLGHPFPHDFAYFGSLDRTLEEPDTWDSDGFEYGVRVKADIFNSLITLLYFNGVANKPAAMMTGMNAPTLAPDGRMIMHPQFMGYYPDFEFVGLTLTRDFERLYINALGGVAPVVRMESIYAFDSSFDTSIHTIEKYDEFRWSLGIDWKIKVNWLNPRAYFMISPQFIHHKILDYPSYGLMVDGVAFEDDNYTATLLIQTTYFHNKLTPFFFWMRNITDEADFFLFKLSYEYSDKWNYTLGGAFFHGSEVQKGFEPFNHKDHVFFTIGYRF